MRHRGCDALNRLLAADFSTWNGAGWTATLAYDLAGMQYDKAGNITALQRYGPSGALLDNLTYAYTAGTNRLAAVTDLVGGTGETWDADSGGFTYDANGNMVTGPAPYGMTAVTYDHRNLPLVLTANGVTSAYRYDEQGQRIGKQVGGGNTEYYVLDGRTALGVVTVDGAGSAVTWTWNLLAGDKVVGRETQTAQRFYYHTDLLGSTRVVVQGTTVVEAYDYDPWGVRLDGRTVAGATKEGFTTKERDPESELDYFGARYYMAALGRWTSVDPLVDSFPEWNGYNYVENDPVRLSDPFGLRPDECPPCDPGPPPTHTPQGEELIPRGPSGKPNTWIPTAPSGTGDRPTSYKPGEGTPGPGGGQPRVSWDDKNKHWDYNDGRGNPRRRFLPDGTEVDHNNRPVGKDATPNQVPKESRPVVDDGSTAARGMATAGLIYWVFSELSRLFPPRNLIPVP